MCRCLGGHLGARIRRRQSNLLGGSKRALASTVKHRRLATDQAARRGVPAALVRILRSLDGRQLGIGPKQIIVLRNHRR